MTPNWQPFTREVVNILQWIKCTDHKPTDYKPVFATLNNKEREVIETYYDPRKDCWCYPHSFGTAVVGEVIAWAEKFRGYSGERGEISDL